MNDGRAIDLHPITICISGHGEIWFEGSHGLTTLDEAYLIHGTIAVNEAMKSLIEWFELQPKKEYKSLDTFINPKAK